jgi:hypothetical protein
MLPSGDLDGNRVTTSLLAMNIAAEFPLNGDNVNFFPLGLS